MKKISVKLLTLGLVGVVAVTSLTGCGTKKDSKDGVTKVIIGTGTSYEPYCYLDKNGQLAGYEYEVLKAIDELLPQYEFEFQTSEFKDILVALDAGQIDLAAHQYEINPERQEKYLFGEESYTTFVTYPTVLASRDDLNTIDDLQGKSVFESTGDNGIYFLEEYNKTHEDNKINIVIKDSPTSEELVTSLKEGLYDGMIRTKRDVEKLNKEYGNGEILFKQFEEPLQNSSTYWLYKKGNTKLQTAVDGALKELKESGKLSEISIQVLGADYTESE